MTRTLQRILVDHPLFVDETYFEQALIHAIVPCLFEKTAGRMIGEMHGCLTRRG